MNNTNLTHRLNPRKLIRGLLLSGLLGSGLFCSNLFAQMIDGSHWIIKPGDSLYKIARIIYPESTKKQAQLRKALVKQNPDVFKNGTANISVGDQLQLPEFATQQDKPTIVATPVVKPEPIIEPVTEAAIETDTVQEPTQQAPTELAQPSTPDPEDIVGQVVINIGSLTAQNRGSIRNLSRRSVIYQGDTLATGGRSHTQIRLKDGALLSLRPHTNIKIAEYNYNGSEDGSERSIIELLKGGFRTITGAIGHMNKQNYQIRTSMATIGIRGTHYSLVLCQQSSCSGDGEQVEDGLYGGVADGSIVIENQSGMHAFNNDQFFHLASASAIPVETLVPPHVLQHNADQSADNQADNPNDNQNKQQTDHGQSPNKRSKSLPRRLAVIFEANQPNAVKKRLILPKDITAPPLSQPALAPNGSAVMIAFNENDPNSSIPGGAAAALRINANNNNVIILGPKRIPVAIAETFFDIKLGRSVTNSFAAIPTTGTSPPMPSDLGKDTNLGVNWGRWNGDFTLISDNVPTDAQRNLHFMYSENMTSPTQLANLGGIKSFATYLSIGGTLPTDNAGNTGTNFASISMGADFIKQEISNYDVSASVTNAVGTSIFYSAGILAPVPFAALNDSFLIDGSGCTGGPCTGEASVLFVGPTATGAITAYQINDIQAGTSITGTALLSDATLSEVTQPVQ